MCDGEVFNLITLPFAQRAYLLNLSVTLEDLSHKCGGRFSGSGATTVTAIVALGRAVQGHICLIDHPRWLNEAATSAASILIVKPEWASDDGIKLRNLLIHRQPRRVALLVVQILREHKTESSETCVHPTAIVHPTARIGNNSTVGAHCCLGEHVSIGDGSFIGPSCTIGARTSIGPYCRIDANVTIYEDCHLGRNCVVHAGAVIGADGFFFDRFENGWERLASAGCVVIGDDVHIGANSTLDRGAIDDTIIGNGVKLDNLVQVAHDVRIGDRSVIAACTGIAGGTHIGADAKIAGKIGIAGNLTICPGVQLAGGTMVSKSIPVPGGYAGALPFAEHSVWRKNFSLIRRLAQLRDRIVKLEQVRKKFGDSQRD